MRHEQLQRLCARDEYYWGEQPNRFAWRVLELLDARAGLRAVDIGAGEGRDATFFARWGLDTLAVDTAANGLEKTKRLARKNEVTVRVQEADINSLLLNASFDLVYSAGAVQYLEPVNRERQLDHFQRQTNAAGLHALLAFVDHPDVPPAPDWGENEFFYAPGELRGYYAEWECLYSRGFVFDDDSGGEPHQHAVEEYIFKKPKTLGSQGR